MPARILSSDRKFSINNTVKLNDALQARVSKAMEVAGYSVWAEFCRVALTEKCQGVERELRERDPPAFLRVYGPTAA